MVTIREYEHALYDVSRVEKRRLWHNRKTVAGVPGPIAADPLSRVR